MTSPVGEDDLMAWIDGRLPADRRAEVDAFLREHPDVQARVAAQAQQARALCDAFAPIAAEPLPASMRVSAMRQRPRGSAWQIALAACLLLAVGFGSGWMSARLTLPPSAGIAALAEEATDNYRVYASDTLRPAEIGPERNDVLVRWASARLGNRLAIPDLSKSGYRYAGGRLVATAHGPAALLLYDGAGGRLALLTRPMAVDKSAPMALSQRGGVDRVSWAVNGIGYSVVGIRSMASLHPIADEIRRQLARS